MGAMESHSEHLEHPGGSILPSPSLRATPPLQPEESIFPLTLAVSSNAQVEEAGLCQQ